MDSFRRALWLATAGRYFSMATNLATLAIVSRLLKPEEIGVFVVGSATVVLLQSLREFGTANYLIQRPHLTDHDVRGPFTVMVLLSAMVAATLAIGAPWVAAAYGESGLTLFLRIAALSTLIDLCSHPIIALLSRQMAFGKVAAIGILNAALNLATTVLLVELGFGFMSFAWAWLASSVGNGLAALWLRPQLRIFLPSITGWRDMLAFGSRNGANYVLQQLYEQIPYLLLGRFGSAAVVGTYNRAFLVSHLPDRVILGGVIPVVLPAVSKQVREACDVKAPYLRGIEVLTGVQWPILMLIALLAHPVVRVVLGEQWIDAAPLVQVLALATLFSFAFPLNSQVLVAIGAMRDLFRCSLAVLPVSTLIAGCAAIFGAEALALSLLLVVPLQAYAAFRSVQLRMNWAWRELGLALGRSAAVTACSMLGPMAILAMNGFRPDVSIPMAVVAGLLSAAGWLGGVRLTRHPILHELQPIVDHFRTFVSRRGQSRRRPVAVR